MANHVLQSVAPGPSSAKHEGKMGGLSAEQIRIVTDRCTKMN